MSAILHKTFKIKKLEHLTLLWPIVLQLGLPASLSMILSTSVSRALKTFYSPEVNSPVLGDRIIHNNSIATGKTQREHKGILHVPDLRTVYQKAGPPLGVPHSSCKQLNEEEAKTLLSTEETVSLPC